MNHRQITYRALAWARLLLLGLQGCASPRVPLQLHVNDQAPDFVGKDQNGNMIQLSDFKNKKLALYFYPQDNTWYCTDQACSLRDNYKALQKAGYALVGVSADSEASHRTFIKNNNLPFPLIADEDHSIHKKYGTCVQRSFLGKKYWATARVTFVIDAQGKIERIIDQVDTAHHADQILAE